MRLRPLLLAPVLLSFLACGDDDDVVTPGATQYEIKYESVCGLCSNSWFGGDNRAVGGPRNVGIGCSVLIDTDIFLESFAFYLERRFDYIENPTGTGHDATLRLTVRDGAGVAIKAVELDLPGSFNGGWVTWENIDMSVDANTTLIFTSNLMGAFSTNQVWSAGRGDDGAGYPDGVRYTKQGTDDASMDEWTGWTVHSWDAWFWLKGRTR
jgi:hypothetical protein